MRRVLAWTAAGLVLAALAGLGSGGWYYSDQLLPAPLPADPDYVSEITAVDHDAGTVTLAETEGDLVELDSVGLLTDDGTLLLDGPARTEGGATTRDAELLDGVWPRPGDLAAASIATFAGDPATTLGLPFDLVGVQSELGELPAWRVVPNGARTDTWVVIIHGRGADLAQGNRLLPTLHELRLPSLTISVRNDPGAPADPDGFGYYGDREWEDLEAAIEHLRSTEDLERVVLAGYSQGASIALSYLRRSDGADVVDAMVLVSPLVSLHETLVLQAQARDIPDPLIPSLLASTRWICTLRAGLDFDEVEHLDRVDELPADVPMLVTHGSDDATVPVGPSRALRDAIPGEVVYAEYAGVDHVREWNADRDRFETDLRDFLDTEVLRADVAAGR